MKSLIKKLISRRLDPKPFFGVRIPNGQIEEEVILENAGHKLNVSNRHNIVCERPFCIAVWIGADDLSSFFEADKVKLKIIKGTKSVASLDIKPVKKLEQNNGAVFVFQVISARCYQLNLLYQYLLIRLFFTNRRHTYTEALIYCAVYSYPRKVIVTSFRDHEYYNIFPMDFQGEYPEINTYLLGLKTSNITVNKIIETKRVVVSTTDDIDSKTIYDLGAHHSNIPPTIENLSFKVRESELLKFPVPGFSSAYKEIEIIGNYKLGSHMMLVGRILNAKKITENHNSLYHVHFFEQLHAGYKEI